MRTTFLYALLVGLPIVGIVVVLHIGKQLTPPARVEGTWAVTLSPLSCKATLPLEDGDHLEIRQSGIHLNGRVNGRIDSRLSGRMKDRRIELQSLRSTCPGKPTRWDIKVLESGDLDGVLHWPECSCERVSFSGTRTDKRDS